MSEAVVQRGGEAAVAGLGLLVGEGLLPRPQPGHVVLDLHPFAQAVTHRLPDHYCEGERVASGVVQQRSPGGDVEPLPLPVGEGFGQLHPLLQGHRRHLHQTRLQIAQPPPLVPPRGEQELRLCAAGIAEEVVQGGLLLRLPRRLAAAGEAGDRLDVVPDP